MFYFLHLLYSPLRSWWGISVWTKGPDVSLLTHWEWNTNLFSHLCPPSEDQHSQRGRTPLLLPPLHLRSRHGKHPPRLQWLSRYHTEDAPTAVRALVMGSGVWSAYLPTDRPTYQPPPYDQLANLPYNSTDATKCVSIFFSRQHNFTVKTCWTEQEATVSSSIIQDCCSPLHFDPGGSRLEAPPPLALSLSDIRPHTRRYTHTTADKF